MFLVVTNRSFRSLKAWNENKGNWRALSVGSRRTLNERCDGGTTPGNARRSEGLGTSVERRSQKKPHRLEIENF
ncbi:hypothetical protein AAC387_Pa01g2081 [Persea americana]